MSADGVSTTPLSGQPDFVGGFNPETEQILQASIENGYDRFLGLVAKSRGKTPAQVSLNWVAAQGIPLSRAPGNAALARMMLVWQPWAPGRLFLPRPCAEG